MELTHFIEDEQLEQEIEVQEEDSFETGFEEIPTGRGQPSALIPLLQILQDKYGYISEENIHRLSRFLRISENHIYGVASFYSQFRFNPPGEHSIRVCLGTACHVQGGEQLTQEAKKVLRIEPGQTTPDGRFDYDEVACLGCCAQAAVVMVDGKIHGKMTPAAWSAEIARLGAGHGRV